jgi:hypothetical protein
MHLHVAIDIHFHRRAANRKSTRCTVPPLHRKAVLSRRSKCEVLKFQPIVTVFFEKKIGGVRRIEVESDLT